MKRILAGILGATTILVALGVTSGAAHAWDCSKPENYGVAECPYPSTTTTTVEPTTTTTEPTTTTTVTIPEVSTTTTTIATTPTSRVIVCRDGGGLTCPTTTTTNPAGTTSTTTKPVVTIGTAATMLPRTGLDVWVLVLAAAIILAMGIFIVSLCKAASRGDEMMHDKW